MKYSTYGVRVDAKGNYALSVERLAFTKREAARQRHDMISEMQINGKDRVYKSVITFVDGRIYRSQSIPGALA